MDDDLDDLLNEVESKYCVSKRGGEAPKPKRSKWKEGLHQVDAVNTRSGVNKFDSGQARNTKQQGDADLNSMIDEIFDDSIPKDAAPVKNAHSRSITNSTSSTATKAMATGKCFPVFLGGSECPRGIATGVHQRTCDNLRCTDCDFKVEIFDDLCWHPKTDYLFLRNNIPDFEKLKVNLVNRHGWRAYACQCKSKSVGELMDLQETNLKWVCGKH